MNMNNLFEILLRQTLKERFSGIKYELTPGFYDFSRFYDINTETPLRIDLGKSVLITKSISTIGYYDVRNLSGKDFFHIKSNRQESVFKNLLSIDYFRTNVCKVFSDFPTVHDSYLYMNYDLNNFLTNVKTDIYFASLEYVLITKI